MQAMPHWENSFFLAAAYSSMVPWRSRWSWLRFVNTATSKLSPATLSKAREWEETSITTWVQPSSFMA